MSPASEIDFQRAAVVNAQLNEVVAKRENTSWYPKQLRAIYIPRMLKLQLPCQQVNNQECLYWGKFDKMKKQIQLEVPNTEVKPIKLKVLVAVVVVVVVVVAVAVAVAVSDLNSKSLHFRIYPQNVQHLPTNRSIFSTFRHQQGNRKEHQGLGQFFFPRSNHPVGQREFLERKGFQSFYPGDSSVDPVDPVKNEICLGNNMFFTKKSPENLKTTIFGGVLQAS